MKAVTMIKFMKKEELVDMIVQIKNFKHPVTHKAHHRYVTGDDAYLDKWNRAKYRFNMNNLDFVDPLMNDEGGYVRYHGASSEVLDMLKEVFGFELEEE